MIEPRDLRWWTAEKGSVHTKMIQAVRAIRGDQEAEKLADVLHEAMYGNQPMLGFTSARRGLIGSSKLALNVVRNMIGAVTSKIAAKNKPKPTFLTEEGNYELRDKAEKLEKYVDGVVYEEKVYAKLPLCFRDAGVYGTTFAKIEPGEDGKGVSVKRVSKKEIVVDRYEARDGEPSTFFHRRYVDTLALVDMAKRWAEEDGKTPEEIATLVLTIEAAAKQNHEEDIEIGFRTAVDQVLVTEGWRAGKGGRWAICIDGADLHDAPWDGPPPFAWMHWSPPQEGFFGVGLAEELMGIQAEINKLLQQIQRGHHLIAGHWVVEAGSKVAASQINNDLAALIRFTGSEPKYYTPQIISPEVYQHLWQLYAKAFEIAGISQLNATGQKPAGLDSGAAQRAYQDIQTERFLEVGQAYEEFVVEIARQIVRCAKRMGGSHKVRAPGKAGVTIVDWSDIDLEEDLYVIRVYPTSLLPSTPAGRLAWAQDMINSGVLPPEDVLDVVDFPDTEQYAKRKNAARRIVERNISHMIRTGEYVSPEPFDNHKLALRIVNEAYHEARLDGVPEAKLELLRQYMADTQDFLGQEMPPPAPPMPMPPPGAMPPGPPPMGGLMAPPAAGQAGPPMPPPPPAAMAA